MKNDLPEITDEFMVENKNYYQKNNSQRRKGGPYSKHQRDKRREEVYRLHFEYGYSGRKIADLMKMNRNTINGDIDYWYSKIVKNTNLFNPEGAMIIMLERLEVQRTRLREKLDKVSNIQEKNTLERLIFDIDSKILYTYQKCSESRYQGHKVATDWFNDYMKKNKIDVRYITFYDTITVSEKAKEKINKIINEDKLRVR